MNQDIIAGNWKQLKGRIQAKWGDLTDDDFKVAEGERVGLVVDQIIGSHQTVIWRT